MFFGRKSRTADPPAELVEEETGLSVALSALDVRIQSVRDARKKVQEVLVVVADLSPAESKGK